MIRSLRDIFVVCDLDNALLTDKNCLPACNKATIELLRTMGGHFTIATVRSPQAVQSLMEGIKFSHPIIACGGTILYDVEEKEHVVLASLHPDSSGQVVQDVMERFSDVGIEIVTTDGKSYVAQSNEYLMNRLQSEMMGYTLCPIDQVPTPWVKITIAAHPIMLRKVQDFLSTKVYSGLAFVPINIGSLDIMPSGTDKASALKELCKRELIPVEHTVVIGGHFSDITLMKAAGHAVAVGNAPPEVKVVADEIVSNCIDGGAGEYIYSLVKRHTQSN